MKQHNIHIETQPEFHHDVVFDYVKDGNLQRVKELVTAENVNDLRCCDQFKHCEWMRETYYDSYTPLHEAAYRGKSDIADYLLSIGALPSILSNVQETVLHHVSYGFENGTPLPLSTIKKILEKPVDISVVGLVSCKTAYDVAEEELERNGELNDIKGYLQLLHNAELSDITATKLN